MANEELFLKAIGRASLVAGPLFVMLFLLFEYQASAPAPVNMGATTAWEMIGPTLLVLALSTLVGAFLAFPVCLILGGFLLFVANLMPLARPAVLWIAFGGGAATAISWAIANDVSEPGAMAFIVTAMACAALVRSRFHWA